ncbi:hypothetical protein AC249_AIPGENE19438 [Exaiptasia diaphana]|nr:hypothetical protein AC249_AIPGENE19438 [Exaiptasia diaphana]
MEGQQLEPSYTNHTIEILKSAALFIIRELGKENFINLITFLKQTAEGVKAAKDFEEARLDKEYFKKVLVPLVNHLLRYLDDKVEQFKDNPGKLSLLFKDKRFEKRFYEVMEEVQLHRKRLEERLISLSQDKDGNDFLVQFSTLSLFAGVVWSVKKVHDEGSVLAPFDSILRNSFLAACAISTVKSWVNKFTYDATKDMLTRAITEALEQLRLMKLAEAQVLQDETDEFLNEECATALEDLCAREQTPTV